MIFIRSVKNMLPEKDAAMLWLFNISQYFSFHKAELTFFTAFLPAASLGSDTLTNK